MNAKREESAPRYFDRMAEDLMRFRSRNIPEEPKPRRQYIERESALLIKKFSDPSLAQPPDTEDEEPGDQQVISLLKERFRSALAMSLTLSEMCQADGMPKRAERLEEIANRSRHALRELDAGTEGTFASLLPSTRKKSERSETDE